MAAPHPQEAEGWSEKRSCLARQRKREVCGELLGSFIVCRHAQRGCSLSFGREPSERMAALAEPWRPCVRTRTPGFSEARARASAASSGSPVGGARAVGERRGMLLGHRVAPSSQLLGRAGLLWARASVVNQRCSLGCRGARRPWYWVGGDGSIVSSEGSGALKRHKRGSNPGRRIASAR